MTEQQQEIWVKKYLRNFPAFAEEYLKIKDKKGEIVPFKLNTAQIRVLDKINEQIKIKEPIRALILKARQKGISTLFEAYIFWRTTFAFHRKAAIVGHKVDATNNLYAMTKRYFKYLPESLKPEVEASNEKGIKYGILESEIKLYTAESGDVGSSDTLQDLHLTEVAKWRDPKTSLTALLQTVPDQPNTMVVMETTAKGIGGEFYDRWQSAKAGESNYLPIFLSWLIDDEYTLKFRDEDDKYKLENSLDDIEHGLIESGATLEHLNWRRKIGLPDKCGGDVDQFRQEYPCLPSDVRIDALEGIIPISEAKESIWIEGKYYQGETECYRIKTKLGYEVEATKNHLFLNGSFKKVKDLKVGDILKLGQYEHNRIEQIIEYRHTNFAKMSIRIDEKLALFIGLYMGDGDYYFDSIGMACDRECQDLVNIVKRLYTDLFGGYGEKFTGTKKGCHYIRKSSKKFKELFKNLELIYEYKWVESEVLNKEVTVKSRSAYKRWIHAPSYIFKSPSWVIRSFLRGLFEADGFVDKNGNRVILFSKYKGFLKEIHLLLLSFGITAKLNETEKITGEYSYIGYELILRKEESAKFAEEIGFLSKKKIERINGSITRDKTHSNAIPLVLEDEITSIEPVGVKSVYDVTTPTHQVIANGFITHNSNDVEAFIASGSPVFDAKKCNIHFMSAQGFTPITGNLEYSGKDKVIFQPNERGYIKIFDENLLKDGIKDDELHRFANGADVAEGLAQGDYSVNATWDKKTEQVCMVWRGHIDPDLFGEELHKLQLFQKSKGFFAVEKNNHGYTTIKSAYKLGVKLYHNQTFDKGYPSDTGKLGFTTTGKSKAEIINDINEWIREGFLNSKDKQFWAESLRFVRNERGQMQAQGKDTDVSVKSFDDCVIAYALMIRCSLWMPNYRVIPKIKPVARPFIRESGYETTPASF